MATVRIPPAKPYAEYPLFAHAGGVWAKKIKGKLHYFGPWHDWKAALEKYKRQVDDLHLGLTPDRGEGVTVERLTEHFLAAKERKLKAGELSPTTLKDYQELFKRFDAYFGCRKVSTLRPIDFDRFRSDLAETHGPHKLTKDVQGIRTLLKYAKKTFKVDVETGDEFAKPSRAVMRKHQQQVEPRLFAAEEIRAMLKEAGPQLKAMILLGINCGLGNHDCELLTIKHVKGEWLEYPRPKTSVPRRAYLWKETRDALQFRRPNPKDSQFADRVFITKGGNSWEGKSVSDNPVSKETRKVLNELGIKRKGVNFYSLRSTFRTVAEELARDERAIDYVMGHDDPTNDMGRRYTKKRPSDERLKAVADHVHDWLFGKKKRKPR